MLAQDHFQTLRTKYDLLCAGLGSKVWKYHWHLQRRYFAGRGFVGMTNDLGRQHALASQYDSERCSFVHDLRVSIWDLCPVTPGGICNHFLRKRAHQILTCGTGDSPNDSWKLWLNPTTSGSTTSVNITPGNGPKSSAYLTRVRNPDFQHLRDES